MSDMEQLVAQMLTSMKSSTDWLIEGQRREYQAHDQKLAGAEAVLRKALDFVVGERARIQAAQHSEQQSLRRLHEQLNPNTPVPPQPPPRQIRKEQ